MGKFFSNLISENLIKDWGDVLDWIFNDNKFPQEYGWNRGYTGLFTKKVKKLPGIKDFEYPNKNNIQNYSSKNRRNILIAFDSKGDGEAKVLIKHIRNGIAHGRTNYKKVSTSNTNELFIEIKDFKSDGKTQTAYIFFPISYIVKIHKIYAEIEKSIRNNKMKGRKPNKDTSKESNS